MKHPMREMIEKFNNKLNEDYEQQNIGQSTAITSKDSFNNLESWLAENNYPSVNQILQNHIDSQDNNMTWNIEYDEDGPNGSLAVPMPAESGDDTQVILFMIGNGLASISLPDAMIPGVNPLANIAPFIDKNISRSFYQSFDEQLKDEQENTGTPDGFADDADYHKYRYGNSLKESINKIKRLLKEDAIDSDPMLRATRKQQNFKTSSDIIRKFNAMSVDEILELLNNPEHTKYADKEGNMSVALEQSIWGRTLHFNDETKMWEF